MLVWLSLALAAGGGGGTAPSARLTLKAEEVVRLGIDVVAVTHASTPVVRSYRGVLVSPGAGGAVATPPLSSRADPEAAARVATSWATAVEAARIAEADVAVARQERDRAARLAQGDAGSTRRLEEADAALARAEARLAGARSRERIARRLVPDAPGHRWVRATVYAGDLGALDLQKSARLEPLGGGTAVAVQPADTAPVADPLGGTVDVIYDAGSFEGIPGQVVAVAIPTHAAQDGRIAPLASVVYDAYGVSWVYVRHPDSTYERQRVQVRSIHDGMALLSHGPAVGTTVVTDGAAELFGHDLGMGR